MVKGIIENTHIISSKIIKFIRFLGYCNFSKMDMYFETDGVYKSIIHVFVNRGIIPIDNFRLSIDFMNIT
jgi:hypothetical protein